MAKTSDGMKIIDSIIGNDEDLRNLCEQASINSHVAQLIYDARLEAGLSQTELANIIGTTQSVISRLEDADYEGHSLSMLNKIAQALNRKVRIDLVPLEVSSSVKSVSGQPQM